VVIAEYGPTTAEAEVGKLFATSVLAFHSHHVLHPV